VRARNCIYVCELLSLALLCTASVSSAQPVTEIEDDGTPRNGMHSCPLGSFISGVHASRNILLCTTGSLDSSSEFVDHGTQSHGMHACPEGFVMTGLHEGKNQLACTRLNAALIPRFVDTDTRREGTKTKVKMHACPLGKPLSGIQITKNLLLCGDQFVVRVNSLTASVAGQMVSVNWDVTCTDPACIVSVSGGRIGRVLSRDSFVGGTTDAPNPTSTTTVTYSVSAAAGGGVDEKQKSVQVFTGFTFCIRQPNGTCSDITINAPDSNTAMNEAQEQCIGDCKVTPGACGVCESARVLPK